MSRGLGDVYKRQHRGQRLAKVVRAVHLEPDEHVELLARLAHAAHDAREELDVLVRFEVNGTDDLREALSTVRVLEREGLLSPPRPAAVLIGPRASYAAQARALFLARPARTPPAVTRCP